VHDIVKLVGQGVFIRVISRLIGYCRKTTRNYRPDGLPVYDPTRLRARPVKTVQGIPRSALEADVRKARVLLREIRERRYTGKASNAVNSRAGENRWKEVNSHPINQIRVFGNHHIYFSSP